jgi:hypothetical protein
METVMETAVMETIKHPAGVMGPKQLAALHQASKTTDPVITKGFQSLAASAPLTYAPRPLKDVNIGPYGTGKGHDEFIDDCMQTYMQALMYVATRKEDHAKKSLQVMQAWVATCHTFKGSNAPLECAWGGAVMVRAAELLKHVYPGWTQDFERRFNGFLDKIILPNLNTRYPEIFKWNNNWILTIQEAILQIAFFRNDLARARWVVDEFKKSLQQCVLPCGMCTETKRDQIHAQFQLGSIVQVCEMCFHQGSDMYTPAILKCLEHHAFILQGGIPPGVKKEELKDVWFMPCVWDIAYNHYVNRKKLTMPETEKLLAGKNRRPEKLTFNWGPAWIHFKTF